MGVRVGAAVLAVAGLAGAAAPAVNWSTYGGNAQSTNDVRAGWTVSAAATAKQRWVRRLDGVVYGPPLVLQTGSTRRLFVVTESDSIYSLDAGTGRVLWTRSLGAPPPNTCPSPYGITSSPALDPARGRLYVIGAPGVLQALSLTTGKPVPGWRLRLVTRTGTEYVWSSLRLVGSTVYVATASYCDRPDKSGTYADGKLLAVDVTKRAVTHTFDVVPGPANMGGIWGWGSVSVDPKDGTLYASTGNAQVIVNGNLDETAGWAERVLQLSRSLRVLKASAPQVHTPGALGDEDFGATPALFQPAGCPPLVAANSKNGRTYIWRRGVLGAPLWSAAIGPIDINDGFLGQPAWDAARGQIVISQAQLTSASDPPRGVVAFRPGPGCTSWTQAWGMEIGGGAQPPPVILGDVVLAMAPGVGEIYAGDARTGSIVWSAQTGPIVAPLATDGRGVFAAGLDGRVHAYAPAAFTAP